MPNIQSQLKTITMICRNGHHEYQREAEYDSRGHVKRNQLYCDDCKAQGRGGRPHIAREQMTERGRQKVESQERNIEIIKIAQTLLSEETPITIRRLHYLLVSDKRAVDAGYENNQRNYDTLDRIIIAAREKYDSDDGYISPLCFVDETRTTIKQVGWTSLSSFAGAFSEHFNLDMWQNQPRVVEVIVEKDGLLSVLGPICSEHQIYLRSLHGQTSITLACEIARRFAQEPDKIHTVLYGGDHDPCGYRIEEVLKEKIIFYADRVYDTTLDLKEWKRWGLLEDDFAKHGIASLDPKEGDRNLTWFLDRFGPDAEFAEVDSLPTQEVIDRVTAAIDNCKDHAIWQADLNQRGADQKRLKDVMAQLL